MESAANSNPPHSSTTAAATESIGRTASPPWTQIVRGPEPEPTVGLPASPSSSAVVTESSTLESGAESNAGSKKPAWNKKPMTVTNALSNGGVDGGDSGAPVVVMSAELWPALSESTKASPKRTPLDASKNLPDFGSILSPQVTGPDTPATLSEPVRSPKLTLQKQINSNSNHHPPSNHGRPTRQKSMKRDGGVNAQSNVGFSHHNTQQGGEGSQNNHSQNSPKANSASASEGIHREYGQRNASGEAHHHRNPFRRANGGPHSRGDGSHQTYGGRHNDQERGNHNWNHQRSFNGRDGSMQPRVSPRGFVRPQPVSSPYVHPPPVRAFVNPMMPDVGPFVILPSGMHLIPQPPHMFFAVPDPELYSKIMAQIDYYFSNENLVKDTFLRRNMDENGWVSVDVIANFNKVMNLTKNPYQILDAVRSSAIVEVQGDKIRRRDDWMRWLLPLSVRIPSVSSSQSPIVPPVSTVSAHFQSITLDNRINEHNNAKGEVDVSAVALVQSSSEDLSSSSQTAKDEASSSGC